MTWVFQIISTNYSPANKTQKNRFLTATQHQFSKTQEIEEGAAEEERRRRERGGTIRFGLWGSSTTHYSCGSNKAEKWNWGRWGAREAWMRWQVQKTKKGGAVVVAVGGGGGIPLSLCKGEEWGCCWMPLFYIALTHYIFLMALFHSK